MSTTNPIAVIGATGQQGGAVLSALRDREAPVRAIARDEKGNALAGPGVEVAIADLDDPEALRRAFDGVSAVFAMTTMTGPSGAEGEVQHGRAIADAAKAAGVPHLVYSSVGGAERDTGIPHFESKWRVEQYLEETGVPHVVVRPAFFMENFLIPGFGPVVEDDTVVLRFPLSSGVPLQMIATRDIGRAAATALLDPAAVPGGAVELAGDELTAEAIANIYGTRQGLPARFEPLPIEVLGDDDSERMFRWFAELPAYQGDKELTRALVGGGVTDFAAFVAAHPLEAAA